MCIRDSLWLENEPTVRIVAAFAGNDVDEHEAALRSLVSYPSQLEVRRFRYSRAHLEEMQVEVRQTASTSPQGSFSSFGIGKGRLSISLRADQLELAQRLLDSYG